MQRRAQLLSLLSWGVIVAGLTVVAVYAIGLCLLGALYR